MCYSEHFLLHTAGTLNISVLVLPVLALYHGAQVVADLSGEPPVVQLTHPVLEGWIQPQQVLPLGHDYKTQGVL